MLTFIASRHLKPHHHDMLRWFDEYRVKDKKSDDEAAISDESDENLTSNLIDRMVDPMELKT